MVGKLCLLSFVRSSAQVEPCSVGFSLNKSLATITNAHVNKLVKIL